MQVTSLYDGAKSAIALSGQALRSVDEPVEGLLALLYQGTPALRPRWPPLERAGPHPDAVSGK